jgi:beta-glucosidase
MVNVNDKDYSPLLPYGFGLQYGDKNVLTDDLNETIELTQDALTTETFYSGKMHKPWLMWLFSDDNKMQPNANTHQLKALSYRTVDMTVQEDAVQLTLNGQGNAGLSIISKSNFREDLLSAIESKSALRFKVNVLDKPTKETFINTRCQKAESPDDNCGASIEITNELSALVGAGWSELSIDLACFKREGMNFGNLVVPFELASQGSLKVQLADVTYEPNYADKASISCQ